MSDKKKTTPLEILESKKRINVCAPMVRYSKLPFRELVRKYDFYDHDHSIVLIIQLGTIQTLYTHP